jgi:hypothetical protein
MKIEYLDIIMSQNNVGMDPVKIAGAADWLTLSTKKKVQLFIGFVDSIVAYSWILPSCAYTV